MVVETVTAAMAKAASDVIEKASGTVIARVAARLSTEALRVRVQFTKTFQGHLARTFQKAQTVKTVISRDQPVNLSEIYVTLSLTSGEKKGYPDTAVDPCAKPGSRYVLSGTGGAGKTLLMKHLINLSRDNCAGLIPLFIELRNLQFDAGKTLEDCIFKEMQDSGGSESRELFQVALEEGLFVVFLDGFDEIHPGEAANAVRLIRKFSERYSGTSILITTRPKTGAETLQEFKTFHVEPLSKLQAMELIEKTDFDEQTKRKFLTAMDKGLYEKHKTLMSLPILVAMMLLTYRTYADIPDRMTVFYSQAFETLYSIHDSENKELFKREHNAGLAPDVFRKVLQAFCYISLSNHDIEFSEAALDGYMARALKISRVDAEPLAYKSDLINNVCVLQPEGLSYVFVHRSFQEYFAALFALGFSGEDKFRVMDQIVSASGSAVAGMMMELDELKMKRHWLLPKLGHLIERLKDVRRRQIHNQLATFFSPIFTGSKEASFGLADSEKVFHLMEIISTLLGENFSLVRLVDGLKFPTERELVARSPSVSRRPARGANLQLKYPNGGAYYISANEAWVVEETTFRDNFSTYLQDLGRIREALSGSLQEFTAIEDDELFA